MFSFPEKKTEKICVLKSLLKILQANYAYPQDEKTYDWKLFLKFCLPGILFGSFILVGIAGHIYITLKRALWPEPIESIIFLVQMLIMIMILLLWLNNWRNFLVHIDRMNTFAFGIPSQCIVLSKKLDYTIPRLFNGVRVLCLFYGFLRVFDNSFCTNTGLTDDDGYVCNLPFPLWYPIRMNTFGRVIFLWICFIAVALFYFPLLFVLTAIPVTSTHLSIYRIRELKRLLHRNTKEGGCNETIKREELIFFIKYHAEISYCVEAMNNDLGYIHLPYRMLLPVLTALHLFKLINQKDPAALFALLPWFMSIIFLCSLGEHLEFERSSLYTEFNDIPWYYMDVKLRKTYHLFMGKLALPMRIKVKPSSEMSNILLSEILKGTYTFLVYLSSR